MIVFCGAEVTFEMPQIFIDEEYFNTQWKPLIMITLGPTLFDNNNWLITLSGGYKNLHYITVLPDTWLHLYRTLSH